MRWLALIAALLVSACGTTSIATDQKGANTGTVVIGLGTRWSSNYQQYTLFFRKASDVAQKPVEVGRFDYRARGGMFGGEKVDYETDQEKGVVIVATVPEGNYVLYNFNLHLNTGIGASNFSARTPVSIPFTVKAGTVAYLGNFQATEVTGKNLIGMTMPAGGFFAVEDRSATERAISEKKGAPPRAVLVNFTPDPQRLGSPHFVTPDRRDGLIKELQLR